MMDWNSKISKDTNTIAEKDYRYVIVDAERTQTKGAGKLPVCPMLKVTAQIQVGKDRTIEIHDYIVLHETMEWKIGQFLVSIGQKKKGEPCQPNWDPNAIIGKRGWLNTKNNKEGYPQVNRWLSPEEAPEMQSKEEKQEIGDFFGPNDKPIEDDRIPF